MHTIYTKTTMIESQIPTFFAGANTGEGFRSVYPRMADEGDLTRLWILKGGSGTGKSTFLRKVSADVTAAGLSVTHYLCSSDPDSLDAVVIAKENGGGQERYVLLDGTAPHVWEMTYPGAVSEILYLGKFWHRGQLAAVREKLATLTAGKSAAYREGYRSLCALAKLEESRYRAGEGLLDVEKMRGFCARLLSRIPKKDRAGEGLPMEDTCRTWSISKKGVTVTDGLWRLATVHWRIEDACQTAPILLQTLQDMAKERGIATVCSLHPIGERIVELWIPTLSLHLTMGPAHSEIPTDKTISMHRFLQKDQPRGEFRLSLRLLTELLDASIAAFRQAGEYHRQIEEIYVSAMDFAKLNREMGACRKQILGEIGGQ